MKKIHNEIALINPCDLETYNEKIKWMVSVMNFHDTSLSFACSCLAHATKPDGSLSDRQKAGLDRVFRRVKTDFDHLQLDCQQIEGEL